jgi:glyoxylase-like metal-dependent hydrolase (beta-lactamase superfamily II)
VRHDGSQFDRLFADGERIALGALEIEIIATPGHTSDGITYKVGDALFVGDTLFAPNGGTGRCDFPAPTPQRSTARSSAVRPARRNARIPVPRLSGAGSANRSRRRRWREKAGNTQLRAETSEADYVAFRHKRDATLAAPRLLYPSLQVNICAGQLPSADTARADFLRLPVQVCD